MLSKTLRSSTKLMAEHVNLVNATAPTIIIEDTNLEDIGYIYPCEHDVDNNDYRCQCVIGGCGYSYFGCVCLVMLPFNLFVLCCRKLYLLP
jgi:hypothetical protein